MSFGRIFFTFKQLHLLKDFEEKNPWWPSFQQNFQEGSPLKTRTGFYLETDHFVSTSPNEILDVGDGFLINNKISKAIHLACG